MAKPAPKQQAQDAKTLEGIFDPSSSVDWAKYWSIEFKAARDEGGEDWPGIASWQEKARKVVRRYRADKKGSKKANDARINIFPSNIQTQRAILVGNTPKCDVSRRNADEADDDARVAAEMLERVLNHGLEDEARGFSAVITQCTEDRLLPGMCGSRVQFGADFATIPEKPPQMGPCPACQGAGTTLGAGDGGSPGMQPAGAPVPLPPAPLMDEPCPQCQGSGQIELAPAVPEHKEPQNEQADAVYINWRDQLWSSARTHDEVRWFAVAADMGRAQMKAMFTEGASVPLNQGKGKGKDGETRKESPWGRARVWEIWSKEHERVFWYVEGFGRVLTNIENPEGKDPLGLDGFYPFPPPMMANATTDAYLATPDFIYAQDLYDEADELTARIRGIVKAIKVCGVYDKTNSAVRRLLDESCEMELIPVADWSVFLGQKGGLAGAIQLLPVKEMVETVQVLVAQRNLVIEQIFQITGLGDIIRGQQQQSETATTSAIKARFASVRLQDLQKEVARYATDLQRLRKEIIAKHWSVKTIIERSSIMQSEDGKDPQRILRAAQLIKDRHLDFRVVIKPEQISLQDWAVLKQQRTEVLAGLGQFFNSMMPLLNLAGQGGPQTIQPAMTFILNTAQWLVAGMPGASGVESAFDAFVGQIEKLAEQAASQPPAPKPPDPKVQAQALKNQGELQKTQVHTVGRMAEIKAETQANMVQRTHDAQMDVATTEAQERMKAEHAVDRVLGPVGG